MKDEFEEFKTYYLQHKDEYFHSDVVKALDDGFEYCKMWQDFKKSKPRYYEPVLVEDKNNHRHVAWLAVGDDGSLIWTLNTTNIILKNICKWRYI